jgi:hypothetical protein
VKQIQRRAAVVRPGLLIKARRDRQQIVADVAQRQSTAFVKDEDVKNPRISGVFAFSVTPVDPV